MSKKWLTLVISAFLLLFSFSIGVPAGSAASVGKKFIIINKANNQLAYYNNGKLIKIFRVGTGRTRSLTPEGKFKIVSKIVNRPYYKGHIPGGDPRNPLGNRWMGLNARGTWGTTYGIHGNNNPSSIGSYVSSGCVRMYDKEVEWLYNQLPKNTTVIITNSKKSFNTIAAANGFQVKSVPIPSVPVSTPSQILKKGSRGEEVKQLQRKLTSLGYNTKGIDGIFGLNTDVALRHFQKAHKLTVDGIVGPATKKALKLQY